VGFQLRLCSPGTCLGSPRDSAALALCGRSAGGGRSGARGLGEEDGVSVMGKVVARRPKPRRARRVWPRTARKVHALWVVRLLNAQRFPRLGGRDASDSSWVQRRVAWVHLHALSLKPGPALNLRLCRRTARCSKCTTCGVERATTHGLCCGGTVRVQTCERARAAATLQMLWAAVTSSDATRDKFKRGGPWCNSRRLL